MIRQAIEEIRLLDVTALKKRRIVEPHDYGIRNGVVTLLSHQIAGASSRPLPNWRWLEIDNITEIRLVDRKFAGGRGRPGQKHHTWEVLFARVKPAKG